MKIPVGLSNHHVHLTKETADMLFGKDYKLTCKRNLLQKGQYACEEIVNIRINNKIIENVRVIGPYRKYNQLELLDRDCEYLMIDNIRSNSGELNGTHSFTLISNNSEVFVEEGAFVANNHIHMSKEDLEKFNLKNNDIVSIRTKNNIVIDNIIIKSDDGCVLEFHLNKDEGEKLDVKTFDEVQIC